LAWSFSGLIVWNVMMNVPNFGPLADIQAGGRHHRHDVALSGERPGLKTLTATELRVLKLVAEYKTNKEIAQEMFVSYRTVEHHRENICQKLDLSGTHALVKFAVENRSRF
jgi:DNA-binding CsgD family transcriptional regulator